MQPLLVCPVGGVTVKHRLELAVESKQEGYVDLGVTISQTSDNITMVTIPYNVIVVKL